MSSSGRMISSHLSQEMIKTHLERTRKFLPESLIFISAGSSAQSRSSGHLAIVHQLCADSETPLVATRLTFPSHPDPTWTHIHGSCDGLVLVEDDQHKMFVLNPVTREIRHVRRSPFALRPYKLMYGFGYDSVNRDYKVVTLSVDTNTEAMYYDAFVSVYSLKTGAWKKSGEVLMWQVSDGLVPGVYVDGRIHWKALTDYDCTYAIRAFDLAEDKFYKVVPLHGGLGSLGTLSGQLCVVGGMKRDVWVMKEYGDQDTWTKFSSVDEEPGKYKSWPLCKLGSDRVLLLQQTDRKLIAYDLSDKTRKEILIDGISGYVFDHTCFVESLVSSHGYNYDATARECFQRLLIG